MPAALRNVSGSCRLRAAAGLPQVGAGQQLAHARGARGDAGIGPGGRDGGMERGSVGGEGLPVECSAHRERVQQAHGVGQRERRRAGAEGVVVDQRDALLGGQGHVAAEAVGEVGQRAEIALARRAERSHARGLTGVECIDDAREQLGAHARGALREPVREAQHGRAHDVARGVRAGRHAVVVQQPVVVGVHLAGADRHPLAHADARRDAVHAVGLLDRAFDDLARRLYAGERVRRPPRPARRRAQRARPRASVSRSPSRITLIAGQYVVAVACPVAVANWPIDQGLPFAARRTMNRRW